MNMSKDYSKLFSDLQGQIEAARLANKPVDNYIKQQLSLLEEAHDVFVKEASTAVKDAQLSVQVGEVEIKQYSAMKQLATQIGIPTEKYDLAIKSIRTRLLGKEAAESYPD